MPIEPRDDGLAIPEVGPWAKRKYHYLGRYLDGFTTAMKQKGWDGLYYIDLFCGAGFARIRESGEIVASSPVLAANVRFPFRQLHLCDQSSENINACRSRIDGAGLITNPVYYQADANEAVHDIAHAIPDGSLSVAFVDPFNLGGLAFDTIRVLANRKVDLIVLLPDHMDAIRNADAYYRDNPESNLDRFLGANTNWRDALDAQGRDRRSEALRELFQQQLGTLGYEHFDSKRVTATGGHRLYQLMFASKHPIGLRIWTGIGAVDEHGQRELFGA